MDTLQKVVPVSVASQENFPRVERKAIAAAVIGTALEWFDVFTYLYFASTISKLFFAHSAPMVALLATVGTFASSYLVKPLGAMVLSSYADRISAKAAMTLTVSLMGLGTAMIAFTPTYQSIGAWATLILVAARLVQGFSSGGEYGAATSFIVERAPISRRGFFASFQISALGLTSVVGGVSGLLISTTLSEDQIYDWGWRLPFVFGLCIVPIAFFLRRSVQEIGGAAAPTRIAKPVREALTKYPQLCILSIGSFVLVTVSSYALAYYLPTYAVHMLGMSSTAAFSATILTGAIQAIFSPLFGHLSDQIGRKSVMRSAAILMALAAIPLLYYLANHPTTENLLLIQFSLAMIMTAYQAPMPALLCDLFPREIRAVGVAVAHDFTAATFGGFTPLIVTYLFALTGSKIVSGYYLTFAAILSAISITLVMRFSTRQTPGTRH